MASKIYRNKRIGEYIRSGNVACCITGSTHAIVNHHIIGNGYSGMGTKSPDWAQMALTHELHSELHNHGWKSFESKYGRTQKSMVAETLAKIHHDGIVNAFDMELDDWVLEEMKALAYE